MCIFVVSSFCWVLTITAFFLGASASEESIKVANSTCSTSRIKMATLREASSNISTLSLVCSLVLTSAEYVVVRKLIGSLICYHYTTIYNSAVASNLLRLAILKGYTIRPTAYNSGITQYVFTRVIFYSLYD